MKRQVSPWSVHDLLGTPALEDLPTPALVIDRHALMHNLGLMASHVQAAGAALRPHAKTHKSADIAVLQMESGASGVCCAKLGEAQALFAAGLRAQMLITSPIVAREACARLSALLHAGANLMVCVDHPDACAPLSACVPEDSALLVVIDVDPGLRRTGVGNAAAARLVAERIADFANLRLTGVQFYCGMEQHMAPASARAASVAGRLDTLSQTIAALQDMGARDFLISGGGTGTFASDLEQGVLNEIQAGSYVFLDRHYTECDLAAPGGTAFRPALFVAARVISANTAGLATLDAGFKAFAADSGVPAILGGPHAGAGLHFMGDEHSLVVSGSQAFRRGEVLLLQPPHCDPTVNLYDAYHVFDSQGPMAIWPVTARGCSQ
jgi:3-hydroxy-D-aspartate aldolase